MHLTINLFPAKSFRMGNITELKIRRWQRQRKRHLIVKLAALNLMMLILSREIRQMLANCSGVKF